MTTIDLIKLKLKRDPHLDINVYADNLLTDSVHNGMSFKLQKKRNEGRGGWWNEKECSIDFLKKLLAEHVKKGDMIDVINFAAMIRLRELDLEYKAYHEAAQ